MVGIAAAVTAAAVVARAALEERTFFFLALSALSLLVFIVALGHACGRSLRRGGHIRPARVATAGGWVCALLAGYAGIAVQAETVGTWEATRPLVVTAGAVLALVIVDTWRSRAAVPTTGSQR